MINEIKEAIKDEKAVIGTDRVLKNLKLGKLSKVFLTSNAPSSVVEDVNHYAKLSETEVVVLKVPNEELGTLCKKPFSISVLGFLK